MYLSLLSNSLLTLLLASSTLFLHINSTQQLSRRARSDVIINNVVQHWSVGPANPPVSCDNIYGSPVLVDCVRMINEIHINTNLPLLVLQDVFEFYKRGTLPRFQGDPDLEVEVPLVWKSGTCLGELDAAGPSTVFSQTSDEALGTDVLLIAQEIMNDCVDNMAHNPVRGGPWSGGSLIFGANNGLIFRMFAQDSSYHDSIDTESECSDIPEIVNTALACQPRPGQRARPDYRISSDDSDEGQRPAQRPRVCSSETVVAHYSEDATCCGRTNYKWATLTIREALSGVLFGIAKLVEHGVGFCEATSGGP